MLVTLWGKYRSENRFETLCCFAVSHSFRSSERKKPVPKRYHLLLFGITCALIVHCEFVPKSDMYLESVFRSHSAKLMRVLRVNLNLFSHVFLMVKARSPSPLILNGTLAQRAIYGHDLNIRSEKRHCYTRSLRQARL